MKTATAKATNAIVSLKDSRILLKEIKGGKVDRMKKYLDDLIDEKRSLEGKYFTKTAKELLGILKSAEANAKNKTMNIDRLFIRNARADKGEKRILAKSRAPHRGREGKVANIEIVVEER